MRLRPCEGTSRGCCERMMSIERRSNCAASVGRQWRACQEENYLFLPPAHAEVKLGEGVLFTPICIRTFEQAPSAPDRGH